MDSVLRRCASLPWTLFIGILAFVGLLTWLVGWALPLVIFLILLMVMGHEFGHFITAKRVGPVGDRLLRRLRSHPVVDPARRDAATAFARSSRRVREGSRHDLGRAGPAGEEARTYREASYPKKVLFASAGSLMHVVMALALAWVALTFIGMPSPSSRRRAARSPRGRVTRRTRRSSPDSRSATRSSKIDGTTITSVDQLTKILHDSAGKRLTLVVERNGHDLTLHVTPVNGRTIKVDGKRWRAHGYIGIEVTELTVHTSPLAAIPDSFQRDRRTTWATRFTPWSRLLTGEFPSLFHQVADAKAATNLKNQDTRPVSIVGVVRFADQAANAGALPLITILALVNIFVGVLNMLPMLPLDGGYVAIATYERLRSRRGRAVTTPISTSSPRSSTPS